MRKCEYQDPKAPEHDARYYLRDYIEGFSLYICLEHLKDYVEALE